MKEFFWIILFPLAVLWAIVTRLRRRFYPKAWRYRSRLPIICVGNIHSGGSGKTPIVLAIAKHFSERKPVLLARGYRSQSSKNGAKISNEGGPHLYGDEPWMLYQRLKLPSYVGKNRVKMVKRIEVEEKSSLILMDDGFQHLALDRTVDVVAINCRHSLAAAFTLPLGDLREPLSALRFASAFVLTETTEEWQRFLKQEFPAIPIFQPDKKIVGLSNNHETVTIEKTARVGAFCGVADPERFQADLLNIANLSFFKQYRDHHLYTHTDINSLFELAEKSQVNYLVTTEKDWHKVKPLSPGTLPLTMLRIEYEFGDDFWYFLKKRLENT